MIKKILSSDKVKGYFLAFITLFFWSIDTVAIRYLTFDIGISANFIAFSRLFLWWMFLLSIWILFLKKDLIKLVKKENILKNKLFLFSAFFLFLNFFFFHIWLKYTLASDSVILETFSPVFAMLIVLLIFPERVWEKFSVIKKIFFAILIWSIWSSMVIYNSPVIPWVEYTEKFFGDILQVLWMIFFAFFMVYNSELRKTTTSSWILITWLLLTISSILMFPFAISWIDSIVLLNQETILLILLISVWSTWIAYFTWFLASKYLNIITLVILFNIISITTIIIESIFYQNVDIVSWKLTLWLMFILVASIYIEVLNNKNHKLKT